MKAAQIRSCQRQRSGEFWSCGLARELRFDETMDVPLLEDLEYGFRFLENWVLKKAEDAYLALDDAKLLRYKEMAAHLQERMKQFVFGNLVEELCDKNY